MDFEEFKCITQKRRTHKKMKVTGSWGVYDSFKWLRKNGWLNIGRPLKEYEFYGIVRQVNKLLADEIAEGRTVEFPERMGKLELRKRETGAKFVNGKLKIDYPIDWEETLKLWYEDEEARKNKTLKRNDTKYIYRVKYNKFRANYENKAFYEFVLNRFIKRALKKNIDSGKTDTLW